MRFFFKHMHKYNVFGIISRKIFHKKKHSIFLEYAIVFIKNSHKNKFPPTRAEDIIAIASVKNIRKTNP